MVNKLKINRKVMEYKWNISRKLMEINGNKWETH